MHRTYLLQIITYHIQYHTLTANITNITSLLCHSCERKQYTVEKVLKSVTNNY